jgi:tryptophan-rich sensory protein
MLEKECNDCLPNWISKGWLGSPYFWYYLILTVIIIVASVSLNDVTSEWFQSLVKPGGYPSETAFSIIWGFVYFSIFIGVAIAGWDGSNPNSGCVALAYTLLLLSTFIWIIIFTQYHMIFIANLNLIVALVFSLWMIWLVPPKRTGKNAFPVAAFSLLALWLVYANYLGWSIQALNPNA